MFESGFERDQNRTLKTEQSNRKYEEQATEGNNKFLWNFLRVTRTISKNSEACIIRTHENQSETFLVHKKVGQAEKSARGMPWHQEPKKDVTSCDKLREVQITVDPEISEWGNPAEQYSVSVR